MQADMARYSCQVALPGFGEQAQLLLKQAKVLVIGAGGLGCPAAQYLTAAGVGTLAIADFDTVSTSNLHRQILYTPADVGHQKAVIACQRLQQQNPGINIKVLATQITSGNVMQVVGQYDVIVDATDNFETRYLLNDAAVISGKPLVYGAIYQFEGQVAVWNVNNTDGTYSPNYRDLYANVNAAQVPNCAVGGVIPTLAGIIGCMQANEVIKLITGAGEVLKSKVLVFDAQTMQSRIIKMARATKTNITALQQTAGVQTIAAGEAQIGVVNGTMILVDVRTDQEHDEYNIGGMHLELDEVEESLAEFRAGKTYVFYCSSGKRSAEAVKILQQKLPDVKACSLAGGLSTWGSDK